MTFYIAPESPIVLDTVIETPPAPPPESVPEPVGTLTTRGDDYGVIMQDYDGSERGATIIETNATVPDRPVDPDGLLGLWYLLIGWRVSPQGKIIVPLDKGYGPAWWEMFVDLNGWRNADNLLVDGNGYFDTSNTWGCMCSPSGGDLAHLLDEIFQAGAWYDTVERFDFGVKPEKIDGVWYYKGQPVSPQLTPHLFNTRTNRRLTDDKRWITAGGVNNVSWFAAGREQWPLVANKKAAQPRAKIRRYPSLPRMFTVFADSLVVEGHLVPRQGVTMVVDAYKFSGSDTFIREMGSQLWYKADEMLIRAQEPYAASAFDYRCYVTLPGSLTPWMGNRGYRSPVPNWQRQ